MSDEKPPVKRLYGRQRRDAKDGLTQRQRVLAREYVQSGNVLQSGERAGYIARNPDQMRTTAARALKDPAVAREVERLTTVGLKAIGLSVTDILAEVAGIAFAELEPVESGPNGERSIPAVRAPDKLRGLELLGKHARLWTDRVEHEIGQTTLEQLVVGSYGLKKSGVGDE